MNNNSKNLIQKITNKKHLNVINEYLNINLKNNEISLKKNIFNYLIDYCEHCSNIIVNPKKIGKYHICKICIDYYVYCVNEDCIEMVYNPVYNNRCTICLGWCCDEHLDSCCCK